MKIIDLILYNKWKKAAKLQKVQVRRNKWLQLIQSIHIAEQLLFWALEKNSEWNSPSPWTF